MSEATQNIIIAVIGLVAIAFLAKKFLFPAKKKNSNSCGKGDCGCH